MAEFDLHTFLREEVRIEEPKIRRLNLFRKLERLASKHGDPVYAIIARCWGEANETCERSTPSRMFCSIVKLRLKDAALWDEEKKYQGMTLADILKEGGFRRYAKMPLFEKDDLASNRPGHHPKCRRADCTGCE